MSILLYHLENTCWGKKELKRNVECSKQGNNLCLKVFHEENCKIKSTSNEKHYNI